MLEKIENIFWPAITWIWYYINSFTTWWYIKILITTIIMIIWSLIWWRDDILEAAILIYTMDFFLGILLSIHRKNFDLTRFFQWMAKILLFLILLIWANKWDIILSNMLWYKATIWIMSIRARCVLYFWVHELLSLLEKLSTIPWFPIPKWLLQKIRTYKNKIDDNNE